MLVEHATPTASMIAVDPYEAALAVPESLHDTILLTLDVVLIGKQGPVWVWLDRLRREGRPEHVPHILVSARLMVELIGRADPEVENIEWLPKLARVLTMLERHVTDDEALHALWGTPPWRSSADRRLARVRQHLATTGGAPCTAS